MKDTYQIMNSQKTFHIDGLVQERCNSIANALEVRLSCTNPSIWLPYLALMGKLWSVFHGKFGEK